MCSRDFSCVQYPRSSNSTSRARLVLPSFLPLCLKTKRIFDSGVGVDVLLTMGMCSSYNLKPGSSFSRYILRVTGDGGLGRPVIEVEYTEFITLMRSRCPLL